MPSRAGAHRRVAGRRRRGRRRLGRLGLGRRHGLRRDPYPRELCLCRPCPRGVGGGKESLAFYASAVDNLMVGLTLDNPFGMEKPRLWINRRLSPSSSADGRPSPSLYVPQVRDFVHLPHTTNVVAQCTASCRLPLSPRARYVTVSGAIRSSIFDAFPPALIRFALLRNGALGKHARRAIRAASRAILGRARGGELRGTRARLLPAVCPPLSPPTRVQRRAPGASAKSAAADFVPRASPSNRFHRPSPAPR